MSNDIKHVIVVRKDLNLTKGKLATYVAHVSIQFLLENNESDRGDEFTIKLNPEEAVWLRESAFSTIYAINSAEALQNMMLRAELDGIEVYPLFVQTPKEFDGDRTLVCAAFGPASSNDLSKILGKLKLI